jgi:hypothetical protein
MATELREGPTKAGECRQCRTFCDRLIEPRACLQMRCPYLYSYVERWGGARYMGCMRKVFRGEIDMDGFEEIERRGSYGGLKLTGDALPHCQFTVEPAYEGEGPDYECVNPEFFDAGGAAEAEGFDLRDALA